MSDCLVKPCPFCGSRNIKSGGDDKVVGYWCLDCEATGPNQYGRYEWNDRADRIEELEAKLSKSEALLAKAVEAERVYCANVVKHFYDNGFFTKPDDIINRTTLAELKGQDDE